MRLLGVLLSIVVAIGTSPAPASAETVRKHDPAQDVRYLSRQAPAHDTHRADGDILRYRFSYTDRRFRAVVHFRALRRDAPHRYLSVNLNYKSAVQFEYVEAELNASADRPRGRATVQGGRVRCRHVAHRLDYRHDVYRISFPARCLESARSVEASIVSVTSDVPLRRAHHIFVDQAPRPGPMEGDGVRVRRG